MPKYRPRATIKYAKNTRARTRTTGRRYLHGCYHDLVLQGHTGGCFCRVSLFAILAGNLPKPGTRPRATSPPSCAAVLFFAGKRPRGYAHTRGVFSPGRFLRYRRSRALCAGAYAGGTRAHCTEIPRPYSAATAQTAADSLLTQKAAQQPQKRPQRR